MLSVVAELSSVFPQGNTWCMWVCTETCPDKRAIAPQLSRLSVVAVISTAYCSKSQPPALSLSQLQVSTQPNTHSCKVTAVCTIGPQARVTNRARATARAVCLPPPWAPLVRDLVAQARMIMYGIGGGGGLPSRSVHTSGGLSSHLVFLSYAHCKLKVPSVAQRVDTHPTRTRWQPMQPSRSGRRRW